jgi:hypothetical protein
VPTDAAARKAKESGSSEETEQGKNVKMGRVEAYWGMPPALLSKGL